jgi:hypothetical protein
MPTHIIKMMVLKEIEHIWKEYLGLVCFLMRLYVKGYLLQVF